MPDITISVSDDKPQPGTGRDGQQVRTVVVPIQTPPDATQTRKGIAKLGGAGGAATFESVEELAENPPSSGSGGGHTIADSDGLLPARSNLAFVGAGVEVADNEANDATVVTIVGGAASEAGFQPTAGSAASPIPNGVRLRGANLVPNPTQVIGANGPVAWVNLWDDFDFDGQIKVQIDRATNGLGCNSVRCIGGVGGVLTGRYTRETYLARVSQVAEYCASRGAYFYACGGGHYEANLVAQGTATQAQLVAELAALAGQVAQHRNVRMFDLLQEVDAGYQTPITGLVPLMTAAIAACRQTAPDLALTFSFVSGNSVQYLVGLVDFLDHHFYNGFDPLPADQDLSAYLDTYILTTDEARSLPWVVGEFGAPRANPYAVDGHTEWTDALRRRFYRSVRDVMHCHPTCMGSHAWAMDDQNVVDTDKWGLYDQAGNYRPDTGDVLKTFPTSARAPQILTSTLATTATRSSEGTVAAFFGEWRRKFGVPVRVELDLICEAKWVGNNDGYLQFRTQMQAPQGTQVDAHTSPANGLGGMMIQDPARRGVGMRVGDVFVAPNVEVYLAAEFRHIGGGVSTVYGSNDGVSSSVGADPTAFTVRVSPL